MALFITKISKQNFLYLVLIFELLRPTFYYYSSAIARISDFFGLLVVIFSLYLTLNRFQYLKKEFVIPLYFFLIYISIISLSIGINNFVYTLNFLDLVELSRPIIWFTSFLFGFILIRNFMDLNKVFLVLLSLGIVHSMIGLVEYFFSFGEVFFKIYSVPNLLEQGRAGGIVYSHTEYSVFSILISSIALYNYYTFKKIRYLIIFCFLIFASLLSLSKAGVIYLGIYTFFIFLYIFIKSKISVKFTLLIFLIPFFSMLIYYSIEYFSYFSTGFEALMNYEQTKNLSILNRLNDIYTVIDVFKEFDYRSLIGSSPLREYREISYIEITFFNILFRFGLIGVLIYYIIILFPFTLNKNIIDKNFHFLLFSLKLNALCLFISDFTANVSETIKYSFLLMFMYGILYKIFILSKAKNEKNIINNK